MTNLPSRARQSAEMGDNCSFYFGFFVSEWQCGRPLKMEMAPPLSKMDANTKREPDEKRERKRYIDRRSEIEWLNFTHALWPTR